MSAQSDVNDINARLGVAPFYFCVKIGKLKDHQYQYKFFDLVGDKKNFLGKQRWTVTGRAQLWKYTTEILEGIRK